MRFNEITGIGANRGMMLEGNIEGREISENPLQIHNL
jgi:hypothetical protein